MSDTAGEAYWRAEVSRLCHRLFDLFARLAEVERERDEWMQTAANYGRAYGHALAFTAAEVERARDIEVACSLKQADVIVALLAEKAELERELKQTECLYQSEGLVANKLVEELEKTSARLAEAEQERDEWRDRCLHAISGGMSNDEALEGRVSKLLVENRLLRGLWDNTRPYSAGCGPCQDAIERVMTQTPLTAAEVERVKRLEAVAEAAKVMRAKQRIVYTSPDYEGVWTVAHIHRGPYMGPTYTFEAEALDAALAALEEG